MVDDSEETLWTKPDLLFPQPDPHGLPSVRTGLPRADVPLHRALMGAIGETDVVAASLDTAHLYEMATFYAQPRARFQRPTNRVADELVRDFGLPDHPDILYMLGEDPDGRELHVLPIHGDPKVLEKIAFGKESYRRPRRRSMHALDVMMPDLDQVVTLFDASGRSVGSIAAILEEGQAGGTLSVLSHIEALRKIGAVLVRPRTDADLSRLLARADRIFGPTSVFSHQTGRGLTIEQFLVPEDVLRIMELWEQYPDDPSVREAIYTLCRKTEDPQVKAMFRSDYGPKLADVALSASTAYEPLLQLCETRDDLIAIAERVKNNPPWLMDLCRTYSTLVHDTVASGDPNKFLWEKPLAYRIYQVGHDLVKTAILHHDEPGFREDYLHASLQALYDTLNTLHRINIPDLLPKENEMYEGLADYATANAGDTVALSLIAPVVEEYFLLKLKRIIPDEFDRAREFFYHSIGDALNAHANEATGDDELQLSLLVHVFDELAERGYWKAGNVLQDAGSGDGTRILEPFLESPVMQRAPPGHVYAVDADAFPQPSHDQWIAVEQKFEDPDYPTIHARHQGKEGIEPIDAIVEVWSSPNDLEAPNQQRMFVNFSESLRKREGDRPGGILVLELPVGYIQEMITEADQIGSREMGRARYDFPLGEGRTLEKQLEIMLPHTLLIRAMRAGFRPLNLPQGNGDIKTPAFYRTGGGKERAIFVFERVGDPQMTLDLAALEDGQEWMGIGRPDRQS